MNPRQESIWEPCLPFTQSLHFSTFAADAETCLIGTLTGSLHFRGKTGGLTLAPTFASRVTAMESLGSGTYLVSTQDCVLSRVSIRSTGLTSDRLPISVSQPITCMKTTQDRIWLACEGGNILILSLSTLTEVGGIQIPDSSVLQMWAMTPDRLLLSSITRALILDTQTGNAIQVGGKERKGLYGACVYKETSILAARPNGFLWKASVTDGKVISTLKLTAEDGNRLNYGLLYVWEGFVISYASEERELFILELDSGKLVQTLKFERKTALYFSPSGELYRLTSKEGLFRLRQLSVREAFELYVRQRNLAAGILLVKENKSLWDLETLRELCECVFDRQIPVSADLLSFFTDLVSSLESRSPVSLTPPAHESQPNFDFLELFADYKKRKCEEKETARKRRIRKREISLNRSQTTTWLKAGSWTEVKSIWTCWIRTPISEETLRTGIEKTRNPLIRSMLQMNTRRHWDASRFLMKNKGVHAIFEIEVAVRDYIGYMKIAAKSYDRDTFLEARNMIDRLYDLIPSIL